MFDDQKRQPPYESVFFGEISCSARLKVRNASCSNMAYFVAGGLLLCGLHARRKPDATLLIKNPNKQALIQDKRKRERVIIEDVAFANLRSNQRGLLIVSKLRMMRAPEDHPGYMKVFPNNRHGGRKDGLGCPSLSPMRLGPVNHGQPGLPPALLLENWHQSNKVFPAEVDETGEPNEAWAKLQLEMYLSPEPARHKPAARTTAGNTNEPLYSVWVLPDGTRKKCTYIESRQFYCGFYERLANAVGSEASEDLETLRTCLTSGYNLQIVGYDAHPIDLRNSSSIADNLEKLYLDPSEPFGHELVLYTLLAIPDPMDYPWRRHKTIDF